MKAPGSIPVKCVHLPINAYHNILKTLCDKYQKWIFEVGRGQKLTKCTQNWCLNMFWHLSQHKGGEPGKEKKNFLALVYEMP